MEARALILMMLPSNRITKNLKFPRSLRPRVCTHCNTLNSSIEVGLAGFSPSPPYIQKLPTPMHHAYCTSVPFNPGIPVDF